MAHASDPQQLAKELCSLAGLHGNFSSYDLNRFVGSLNSEQARDDLYPLMIRLIRMWAVGKPELRGALRFSTKQEATDALRRLPEQVRHKHIVAEVPSLQLLYFPPYGTRMDA